MLHKKVKCKKNPDISQFYYEPQALSESEAYTSILPIRYPLQPPPPITYPSPSYVVYTVFFPLAFLLTMYTLLNYIYINPYKQFPSSIYIYTAYIHRVIV